MILIDVFTDNGEIKIGYTLQNDNVIFFVKDSGIGLADKQKDHIFERFTKIEDRRTFANVVQYIGDIRNRFGESTGKEISR